VQRATPKYVTSPARQGQNASKWIGKKKVKFSVEKRLQDLKSSDFREGGGTLKPAPKELIER